MARDRDDDYRDDDAPPPRRRDDDDDMPRSRRRRFDDDDDAPRPSGMDGFLGNIAVAIIFGILGFFCPCLGIILGGIGLGTTKTPNGKRGSLIVLVAGVLGLIVNIILTATGVVQMPQQ